MRTDEFMTSAVLTVPPEASRDAVAALLVSHGIASAPVVDGDARLLGLVTESGVLTGEETATARELMEVPGTVVSPETDLPELVGRLADTPGRALPVLRGDVVVGIVGRRDVLRRVAAGELHLGAVHPEASGAGRVGTTAAPPVVVGVDGTDSSRAALRWAMDQVRWTTGPLGLPGPAVRAVLAYAPTELHAAAADVRRRAEEVLDVAVRSVAGEPAVDVEPVVREGHPVAVLAHEARGASMVVLGTRDPGTSGPGPVAGRLVGTVACPVVVIPAQVPAEPLVAARP